LKLVYRKRLNTALLVVVTAVSAKSIAGNNQYQWQDSQGNTVYSDRPPTSGEHYEVVDTGPTLYSAVPDAAPEEGAILPVDGSGTAAKEKNPELCEQAKMNLISLQAGRTLNIRNDKGELKELAPEEREVALQVATARKDVYCD
jgi:hypothetical protein